MEGRIVVVVSTFCGSGSLMQQTVNTESSGGQSASPSMFSHKRASSPLVHFPLHGLNGTGFGLVVVATVDGCLVTAVIAVDVGVIVIVVGIAVVAKTFVDNDVFGRVVVDEDEDETLLEAPPLFFSS